MHRMPRRNKPHNKTEIKKGNCNLLGIWTLFWALANSIGLTNFTLYLPLSRANRTFVFQNGKGKTFPIKQSIHSEGFDPSSVELAL